MLELTTSPEALTVSEVTKRVKSLLEGDPSLQNIWVKGEISNFRRPSSGHLYFTLKDDRSRLRAVMFRSRNQNVKFQVEDGLTVLVRGSISIYEAAGDYQFYVEEMLPAGQGALFLAFEQLKAKLEAEGLFAQKRPLPFFPRRVCLITSPTGAAVRDMISVMRRRNPTVDILLIPAVVQGETAPPSICQAFALAQKIPGIDLIIFGRGGGSLEELWAFNEESVARAVFASRIPTISAVGHETDFTIADFVADYRAPTPSAAAEVAVPELRVLRATVEDLKQRGIASLANRVQIYRDRLRLLASGPALTQPDRLIRNRRQLVDDLFTRMQNIITGTVEKSESRLKLAVAKLDSLSPLATLGRGYAICTRQSTGEVIRDAAAVRQGERLTVQVAKGEIPVRVTFPRADPPNEKSAVQQAELPI